MENIRTKKSIIISAVFLLLTAVIIAFFFPREGKFRYQFNEGKPWRYGLLTAPSDFPIYKAPGEIEAARDSLRKHFEPYFRFNPDEANVKLEEWRKQTPVLQASGVPAATLKYVDDAICDVYAKGIISSSQLELMHRDNHLKINVLTNSVSDSRKISDLYSVKKAYEAIIDNAPPSIDRDDLEKCNVNEYLTDNIFYDRETSEKILEESLQSIPVSTGMVQAGERIVDIGEIIDSKTFDKLRSLKQVHETKSGGTKRQNTIFGGQFILVLCMLACFGFYLATFSPQIFFKRKNLAFILLCVLAACVFSEISVKYSLLNIYIIPFAIIPIVVRTFFNSHTAIFTHIITILICSLTALFPYEFILLQSFAGIVVLFSLKELSQRSQLFRCSAFVFITYVVLYISLVLYQEGDFKKINWEMMMYFLINFVLLMFSYVLIYMLEKIFGYISPITLVELSNINSPILKKLSETAPGTFQHSLQVSILASEAGAKIGADTQLIRTGALYHDIGKMNNPAFFTENRSGDVNPHDKLSFEESARIIISHVPDGVKIAEKGMIPQAIIDFIKTHHGKGFAKYFYNSYRNTFPDRPDNKEVFSYPGPNPFSRETAILMMADSVEAASRSLTEYTDESIEHLINKIIDSQIQEGLLKNAPLTFKDVEDVKTEFHERLKTMYHTRISYPDLKKN
ncbi:MAG: HDIG domain-containing protein [Tannerella sp.]|jgi:putative nucleotidyltransferase with HDIG domain|nr:HDIG domain-containing protein [Tannerella sp.]